MTVDPHQLLGLEVNPRAAAIADLVLWIGYLQWHFRTHGRAMPQEPVLKKFHNIEGRDAILAFDRREPVTDAGGQPVTRWDGRTFKKHPVTGEEVPDETACVPLFRHVNPREADWPEADFVVGNPPFIGNKRMRRALGDGYVEALRAAYPEVPETADFVMYWWHKAATLVGGGKVRRAGLITTNSISQTFSRRLVELHVRERKAISLVFAVPDHPWIESEDGAAVRIAMTVFGPLVDAGILAEVVAESETDSGEVEVMLKSRRGHISPTLRIGADAAEAKPLKANSNLSFMGITLIGEGFRLSKAILPALGLDPAALPRTVRPYIMGRDLAQQPEERFVIDFFGLSEAEARKSYPVLYQHVLDRVKPERDQNPRRAYRERWWVFGEPREKLRSAVMGLTRYVATARTARFRVFQFVPAAALIDSNVVAVASDDAFVLGVLSSRLHLAWAARAGATLEDRPHYTSSTTFEPYPFPACDEAAAQRIRELGESLDQLRKDSQAAHPGLTMTAVYSVLEKVRQSNPLTDKEKVVYDQALVSVLNKIYNDLDEAVSEAYGWPTEFTDDEIVERVVALNAQRAAEERSGKVRWLRSDFQNPAGTSQGAFAAAESAAAKPAALKQEKLPWPAGLADQAKAVRAALAAHASAVTPEQLAKTFSRAKVDRVTELLETLASLGQVREVEAGRFIV